MRLIVHPGTAQAWEIPLKDGVNTLGRGDHNDFPIPDDSVSTAHCEVFVFGRTVKLKDLNSTNGTHIEDSLVTEVLLEPGQRFRLGNVELLFEADAAAKTSAAPDIPLPPRLPSQPARANTKSKVAKPPPPNVEPVPATAPPAPPRLAPVQAAQPAVCKYHPRSQAHWFCGKCNRSFCDLCVMTRATGDQALTLCRGCGELLQELEIKVIAREEKSFFSMLPGAFRYPFNGDGLILISVGTIFYAGMDLAQRIATRAPFLGLMAVSITTVFGVGYLFAYMKRMIVSSSQGEEHMPDWPEFTDWWADVISPFLQVLMLALLCALPFMALFYVGIESLFIRLIATIVLEAMICFVLPMVLLAVAMYDTIFAINPMLIVPSIARVVKDYLVAVLLLVIVVVVRVVSQLGLELIPIPFLPSIIAGFIGLYLLAVETRVLGLLYFANRQKLRWFRR